MGLLQKIHSFLTSSPGKHKQNKKKEKRSLFLEHGARLLEGLISFSNGVYNPIRSFSAEEIQTVTNDFQSFCRYDGHFRWYKGSLDQQRPVLVKYYNQHGDLDLLKSLAYRDIVISSQMSNHNNVLNLIGCCLDLLVPVLVFENADIFLNARCAIYCDDPSLSWKIRLKAAKDIAHTLTYLHTAFSRPIIHRDVKPGTVFFDEDYVVKFADFSLSISIPEGETHAVDEILKGTVGYIDPGYFLTNSVWEQSDVYSLGVLMLVLLSGRALVDLFQLERSEEYNTRTSVENGSNIVEDVVELCEYDRQSLNSFSMENQSEKSEEEWQLHNYHSRRKIGIKDFFNGKSLDELVDPAIWEDEGKTKKVLQSQLQAFLRLILRCIEYKSEDRPFMIDVAKELRQIERLTGDA